MKKQKQKFECSHKGFGKYCHRCKPTVGRNFQDQLKWLDEKGFKATKERKRLTSKVLKEAK
jgi:hypothetical protein